MVGVVIPLSYAAIEWVCTICCWLPSLMVKVHFLVWSVTPPPPGEHRERDEGRSKAHVQRREQSGVLGWMVSVCPGTADREQSGVLGWMVSVCPGTADRAGAIRCVGWMVSVCPGTADRAGAIRCVGVDGVCVSWHS